jgi:thioredoxin reductase (NADPH)
MGKFFDVVIVGGGPGGLTAGLYLARARMRTLLVEKMTPGGQTALTETIENFPGFIQGINGMELMSKIEAQATRFGLEIIVNSEVLEVTKGSDQKIVVKTESGKYECLAAIMATGATHKKLGVPGEEELIGRGVSYCASCDGHRFKNQDVVIVGGGDMAVQESLFLANLCKKVTIVHRGNQLRATRILQERVSAKKNIGFIWQSVVKKIWGGSMVTGVEIEDKLTGKVRNVPCRGLFVFVGTSPNTRFLKGFLHLDENGFIFTDENMQTSEEGIFACGDVRRKLLRQVVTACGEGATAAVAAQHYIEKMDNKKQEQVSPVLLQSCQD